MMHETWEEKTDDNEGEEKKKGMQSATVDEDEGKHEINQNMKMKNEVYQRLMSAFITCTQIK